MIELAGAGVIVSRLPLTFCLIADGIRCWVSVPGPTRHPMTATAASGEELDL